MWISDLNKSLNEIFADLFTYFTKLKQIAYLKIRLSFRRLSYTFPILVFMHICMDAVIHIWIFFLTK